MRFPFSIPQEESKLRACRVAASWVREVMVNLRLRPSLYRTVQVVMSDGSTFKTLSAVRQVGDILQLERDPANHPIFLAEGDGSGLLDKREAARMEKILERERRRSGEVRATR